MKIVAVGILAMSVLFLEGCSGCSKSGRIKSNYEQSNSQDQDVPVKGNVHSGHPISIKMIKKNGVYKIPVMINGVSMDFIFDTGAGLISISDLEANFLLKQGKITKEDILGSEKFEDATGTISDGAIVNLKEVSIGDRTIYNIHASVTNNINAPLLLGQSALEQFGKITIDYANGEIVFQ